MTNTPMMPLVKIILLLKQPLFSGHLTAAWLLVYNLGVAGKRHLNNSAIVALRASCFPA